MRAAQPWQNQPQNRALSYSFGFDGGSGGGVFEDIWPVGHRNTGINVCPQVRQRKPDGCAAQHVPTNQRERLPLCVLFFLYFDHAAVTESNV